MQGEKAGHPPRRVVFVIEGGRSRDDVAALHAVARAVAEAGAQVKLVRHGLGKLSTLQVGRAVRRAKPDLLIVTGATSTRHLQSLAARLGCPLVAYYWPSAAVIDIHRRPRRASQRPGPPARERAMPLPQRAVLGSEQQRRELLALLPHTGRRATLSASGMHILPPLLDPILFAADEPTRAIAAAVPRLGVYGAVATQLPAWAAPAEVVLLDGTPAHLRPTASEATTEATTEAQRLLTCTGVLVLVHSDREAREAARHVVSALVLGKPVLLCGYGERGHDLPGVLAALALPAEILRAAPRDELARELPRFTQQLLSATTAPSPAPIDARLQALRQTLQPSRVLAEHVALILELADLAAQDAADATRPTLGQHAQALGLRLFRRPALLCLRYPRVVAELRGRDLSRLITLETLERQLQTLLQAGYQPVSPTVFASHSKPVLRRGQRFLTVTFADGPIPDASPAPAVEPARIAALLARLGIPSPELTPADAPAALRPICLSEQSSLGPRGRFDAHRLWLTLAQGSA